MASIVGKHAPKFSLEGVIDGQFKTISLDDYKGKWVIVFFYPLDFTFVCPPRSWHSPIATKSSRNSTARSWV